MREIKFRGQRVDNGEWVYGYFVKDPKGRCRIYLRPFPDATSNTYHFVKPETVGQYIGIKDPDGEYIYEGDTIKGGRDDIHTIEWDEKEARFVACYPGVRCHIPKGWITDYGKKVIGNIYEPINPNRNEKSDTIQ